MKELQKQIVENKKKRGFNTTDVGKEIILMTEELGELAQAYKLSNQKTFDNIDNRKDILDAVGDLMVYCLGFCELMDVDSENLIAGIVENNKTRTHRGRFDNR